MKVLLMSMQIQLSLKKLCPIYSISEIVNIRNVKIVALSSMPFLPILSCSYTSPTSRGRTRFPGMPPKANKLQAQTSGGGGMPSLNILVKFLYSQDGHPVVPARVKKKLGF